MDRYSPMDKPDAADAATEREVSGAGATGEPPLAEQAKRPEGDPRPQPAPVPAAPVPAAPPAPAPSPAGARGTSAVPPDGAEAKRQKQRARTRRRRLLFFFVALAVLIGGGGYFWWEFVASRFEVTDDAYVDGEIVRVSPQLEGVLVDVPVHENARVAPGDVLARIDPAEAQSALTLAEAQAAQAETAVGTSEAQVEQAQSQVAQTEAQVTAQLSARDAAAVRAQNTQNTASRYQQLAGRSGALSISTQQVEDAVAAAREAEATLKQAEATVKQAEATVDQAKAAVITAQAELATSRAEAEAFQAQVAQAKVQVGYLTVAARIAGQVVQLNVNTGSYVAPGSQMMALVPDELYVTANFKETQLDRIRVGQQVDLRVDAYPEVEFRGRIESIQRGAGQAFAILPPQNATGNFVKVVQRVPVKIAIEGGPSFADYPIGPGMSVVPTVHIK